MATPDILNREMSFVFFPEVSVVVFNVSFFKFIIHVCLFSDNEGLCRNNSNHFVLGYSLQEPNSGFIRMHLLLQHRIMGLLRGMSGRPCPSTEKKLLDEISIGSGSDHTTDCQ